ncbi:hypothetical protein DV736_g1738, partial [Chaetothyriales sp. CBS 134916]
MTVLPVCCSCADIRPLSEGYPNYVDGIGMTMTGQRWTKYCSRCRDYWASESREHMPSRLGEQPSWSFPPPTRTSSLPGRGRPDQPNPTVRDIAATVETGNQPPQVQPLPPNPFGTREEIAAEDWESPLTSMFSRAWSRFRDAENTRHRLEREMEERLLPEIASESPSRSSTLREEIRHIQALAREMASEITQTQHALTSARQRLSQSPPRVNPIDEQSRPPALTSSDMVVSIACRICNEQRIDSLMEPCGEPALAISKKASDRSGGAPSVDMPSPASEGCIWPPLTFALPSSDPGGDPMQIDDQQRPLCWFMDSGLPSRPRPHTSDTYRSHQASETKGSCGDDYHRLLDYLLLASFGSYTPMDLDLRPPLSS